MTYAMIEFIETENLFAKKILFLQIKLGNFELILKSFIRVLPN